MKKEYFTIIWDESGDEIHFMLLSMEEFELANELINDLINHRSSEADIKMEQLRNKEIDNVYIQTYCTDPFPFQKYNVTKMMYLTQFGC